ncbi:hypothetical protein IAT40_002275 [Kwoniella sp. CBS 6097]
MVHRIFLPPPNDLLSPLLLVQPNHPRPSTTKYDVPSSVTFTKLDFHKLDPPTSYIPGFGLGSQSLPLIERVNLSLRDRTWIDFSQGGMDSLERSTVSVPEPDFGKSVSAVDDGGVSAIADITNDRHDLDSKSRDQSRATKRTIPDGIVRAAVAKDVEMGMQGEELEVSDQNMMAVSQEDRQEKGVVRESRRDDTTTTTIMGMTTTDIDISVNDDRDKSEYSAFIARKRKDDASRNTSRRKSRRLTRQSASFLSALPHLEPSPSPNSPSQPSQSQSQSQSSFDSLDTTTNSMPSQLATNPGNTSVSNFPRWSIPLHKLVSLQSILSTTPAYRSGLGHGGPGGGGGGGKLYTLIACVISTDPVVQRQRKEEKARGGEGTLWIGKWMITAPPTSAAQNVGHAGQSEVTTSVRLWDNLAREWGEKVRRGDVVLLENIEYKPTTPKEPAHLSVSAHHSPKITILYRTLPRYQPTTNDYIYSPPPNPRLGMTRSTSKPQAFASKYTSTRTMSREDRALRPDLRVGRSDAGVKRVEGVVRWFAEWIGGEGPT